MMVFVVALSLMADLFGSAHQDVVAVLLTVMVTIIGIAALIRAELLFRRLERRPDSDVPGT
ncbi:hypothetical protein AB0D35_16345 [Streptomyces sp. NPDC048301]|uniref:hypothetical protein n=1 Tax=unclassified Streptomyces TaxID=2593676 RepID=UPI0034126E21